MTMLPHPDEAVSVELSTRNDTASATTPTHNPEPTSENSTERSNDHD
jgi:hypothetical protein